MLRNSWPLSYMGRRGGASVPTDPNFSSTVLLLGFEGADGSTSCSDESAAAHGAASFLNNAQIDTAQFKYGSSSLLLDGADDRIAYADSADWDFGSGDFTAECWARFNILTGFQTFMSQWDVSGNQQGWLFDFPGSANNVLRFAYSTTGANTVAVQGAWAPSANTWYHVAASRAGNNLYLFADGALIATGNVTGVTIFNSSADLRIGTIRSTTNDINDFNGWIDETRITKGVGRYSSAFSAPTAAFPRS